MAIGLFQSFSSLVAACSKHVCRVSRKLRSSSARTTTSMSAKIAPSWAPYLSRRVTFISFRVGGSKKKRQVEEEEEQKKRSIFTDGEETTDVDEGFSEVEEEDEEGVWRRTILMGEKCQPLDFSGAIYYDSDGRQLSELPPRSPMSGGGASPLRNFSFPTVAVVSSDKGGNY